MSINRRDFLKGSAAAAVASALGAELLPASVLPNATGRRVLRNTIPGDPAIHERVCAAAAEWLESRGWEVLGVTPSPITGPEGNVEFLLGARKTGAQKIGDSSGTWG